MCKWLPKMNVHNSTSWIVALFLLSMTLLAESNLPELKTYVKYAVTQKNLILKTWTHRSGSLSIKIEKENKTLLSEIFDNVPSENYTNRYLINYNKSTESISLSQTNITKSDKGVYHISTSTYQAHHDESGNMDNNWSVQLFVFEPHEFKQGYTGEDIIILELEQEPIYVSRLYHNNQLIASLTDSNCDVSTKSSFYGRLLCVKDDGKNRTRIEIKHVTENDTGLYGVEREGRLIQQYFLNITDASAIITPERHDGLDTNQSTISSTTWRQTQSHSDNELHYILPITAVAVFAILLFLGCLIWIQGRNAKSIYTVQRIVLEAMETSSAAFSTLVRSPLPRSREQIWMSNLQYLENTVKSPAESLDYATTSSDYTSSRTECHDIVQNMDEGYHRNDVAYNTFNICESGSRSNETVLAECHECPKSLVDDCPFPTDVFSATQRDEHLDTPIANDIGRSQVIRSTEAIYAEVNPLSSKTNTRAGPLCNDGYEMVDFSPNDFPIDVIQEVKCENATFAVL